MNIRNIHKTLISISLIPLLLLASCMKEAADNPPKIPARTILFYMPGDNSAGGEIQEKIEALTAAWNVTGRNHLLVCRDRSEGHAPCLLEIKRGEDGKGMTEVLEEYGDENIASYEGFTRVLNDMVLRFPGSDYGMVVFSPATTGWLPAGTYMRPFSLTEDGNRAFELADFARAIPDGQFRFILFESGLMAGAEVAYELRRKTDFIVASSAVVISPGLTPLYGKVLRKLYLDTPDLAGIAWDYYEHCDGLAGNARSATVSVIRPGELAPLKDLLVRAESHVIHWEWVKRKNVQHFDIRETDHLFYDLEGYVREIGTPDETNELAELLDKAVIYHAATEGFMKDADYGYKIEQHSGLTIYIPISGFDYLNRHREKLELFQKNANI